MLSVLSRRLAVVRQRGPPGAAGGVSKADKQAKRNAKKARRAQEVAAKKARKAGALGRVVATFQDVSKFLPDGRPLFTGFSAQVKARARIGIIGPNGSGKSSLLNVLSGLDDDYTGEVSLPSDINVGYLTQSPRLNPEHTVREAVESGLGRVMELKGRFHEICDGIADLEPEQRYAEHRIIDPEVTSLLTELGEIGETISRTGRDNWITDAKVGLAMSALRCPPADRPVSTLSGGEARRVDLARVLLSKPDLLLLDEPTNHLDTMSVAWLEEFLRRYEGTVMCVTHDRYFLDRVANWTLEFDQSSRGAGNLVAFHGNYSRWLEAKDEARVAAARAEDRRSKAMKSELDWIRSKANRRTSQAIVDKRIANYDRMVEESRRQRVDPGRIVIPPGPPLASQVVSFSGVKIATPDGRVLVNDLTLDIPRGAIVGVTGPNGAGKSTLLAAMLSRATDGSSGDAALVKDGHIDIGPSVRFGHVAQHSRDALDDGQTVHQAMMQEMGTGSVNAATETIDLGGGREMPVRAFLALFGFRGGTQDKAVSALSGGERNRLLLARTLASGCNVLLLDEPTNDLDVDTLRSLEEAMPDFPGCAIVVSHDRYFLDRTVTHILHFDGEGGAEWFEGNWGQFEADLKRRGVADKFLSDEEVFRQVSFGA